MSGFVAHAIEIPDDYEQIDLWTPSYLDDYTSNTADDYRAFILWTDITFSPSTNDNWTSTAPLISGGNIIFTSAEGYETTGINFNNGSFSTFEQPDIISFDTLGSVSFSNHISNTPVIDLGTQGQLHIRNINDDIDNTEKPDVLFYGNKGHSIYANTGQAHINIESNAEIAFINNEKSAIYALYYSDLNIAHNDSITFRGNKYTHGAAINSYGDITISGNKNVNFIENSINSEFARGGAIYIAVGGELSIDNNGDVSFIKNSAFHDTGNDITGGAIYSRGCPVNISNNANVLFSGNYVSGAYKFNNDEPLGGAIYCEGALSIVGNESVTFEKNYEKRGSWYRLRGIYLNPLSSNDHLILSAKTGGNITFYDSVYMGSHSGVYANFNADYVDSTGTTQKAQGDIIFSAKYAEQHLNEIGASVSYTTKIGRASCRERVCQLV